MDNLPLVSVISLLYDTKIEYVNECIKSLLNQTYSNLEIIFVDDCSLHTDYSYIRDLSSKIKLFRNNKNLGLNRNVDKAFSLATGKYIVRIDSDDVIDKTLIEKEVKLLEKDETIGAVCCQLERFGRRHQLIKRPINWDIRIPLHGNVNGYGYAGGMMFKRELLKEVTIDPTLRICEDLDFHLQLLNKTKIVSIQEPLYHYRSHDNNIMLTSNKGNERINTVKRIIEKHRRLYQRDIKPQLKVTTRIKKRNEYF